MTIKNPCYLALWSVAITRVCNLLMQINTGDRITRFGILKHRSKQQENFCGRWPKFKENYPNDLPSEETTKALKSAEIKWVRKFLLFKNFYTIDQTKLSKFHVCNQHLLCPFCAGIRASKAMQNILSVLMRYLNKIVSLSLF